MGVGVIPIAVGRDQTRTMKRARHARLGLQAATSFVSFLAAYSVLQLLHALGRDPAAVKGLATIPLFARFWASVCIAGVLGPIVGLVPVDPERSLRPISRTLAIAITIFFAVVIGFP